MRPSSAAPCELSSLPRHKRVEAFLEVSENRQGFELLKLTPKDRTRLLHKLSNISILSALASLDPDQTTDVLQALPAHRRHRILLKLADEIRGKVEYLLKFHPNSAAGLMSLHYVEVDEGDDFGAVRRVVARHEKMTGRFPAILVMKDGNLMGELPGAMLGLHPVARLIKRYVRSLPKIHFDKTEREVMHVFRQHPHNKVAVLDNEARVLGVIYSEDLLRLIERSASNTLADFAGVHREEDVFDSLKDKVGHRYRWLIINLGTAFLAASVVGFFSDTIAKYVLLAMYMPIIAGMGGNAATQTLAVLVRGISLKEIQLANVWRPLLNEIGAGVVNGLINGFICGMVAWLWNGNAMLGVAVAVAMIANFVVAGFFGTLIPLVMVRLGKDPASSATIFISTATDVFGFFVFLGLATLLLA